MTAAAQARWIQRARQPTTPAACAWHVHCLKNTPCYTPTGHPGSPLTSAVRPCQSWPPLQHHTALNGPLLAVTLSQKPPTHTAFYPPLHLRVSRLAEHPQHIQLPAAALHLSMSFTFPTNYYPRPPTHTVPQLSSCEKVYVSSVNAHPGM